MGRSIALSMAREGASVGLISRSGERLRSICGEVERIGSRCYYHMADATNITAMREAARSLVAKLGGVDALVHNAGGWFSGDNVDAIDESFLLGALKFNILGFSTQ